MKRIFCLALIGLFALTAVCEAGIFRKRDGSRRTPVRTALKAGAGLFGGCPGGSCGR